MKRIAKKYARFRLWLQLVMIAWFDPWEAETTKTP